VSVNANSLEKEFLFTERDFNYLSQLAGEQAGIDITASKRELVYGRLSRRLRILGMKNFNQYCEQLRKGDKEEVVYFINAITTNVTSFFRENHHFEFLEKELLPALMEKNDNVARPRLRIWSAGCSSGKEPYSIAMVLRERIPDFARWDAKILATDLDSDILKTARRGIYPLDQIDGVSLSRRKQWFQVGRGKNEGFVRVRDEIKRLISFRQLNLTASWPMKAVFDFIFYRNVAIYFDKPTRTVLIDRIADQLSQDAHLFVGHSESLFGLTNRFYSVGRTVHRKIS